MTNPELLQFLSQLSLHMGDVVMRAAQGAAAAGASLVFLREGLRQVYRAIRSERQAAEGSGRNYAPDGSTWDEWEERERQIRGRDWAHKAPALEKAPKVAPEPRKPHPLTGLIMYEGDRGVAFSDRFTFLVRAERLALSAGDNRRAERATRLKCRLIEREDMVSGRYRPARRWVPGKRA